MHALRMLNPFDGFWEIDPALNCDWTAASLEPLKRKAVVKFVNRFSPPQQDKYSDVDPTQHTELRCEGRGIHH